jgi:hypothetical protein
MPYIPNAQKERLQWCDLSFAVSWICTADRCDQPSAVQQLCLAIADQNVQVSWADRPRQYIDEPIFDSVTPSSDAWWWLNHAKIDLEQAARNEEGPDWNGMVLDDWCLAPLYRGGSSLVWDWIEDSHPTRLELVLDHRIRFRPLLVSHQMLDAIWAWPWPVSRSPETKSEDLPARRALPESKIVEVCRELYAQNCDDPPNMHRAYEMMQGKLGGTPREKIREILRRPEFSSLRRLRGIRKSTAHIQK